MYLRTWRLERAVRAECRDNREERMMDEANLTRMTAKQKQTEGGDERGRPDLRCTMRA